MHAYRTAPAGAVGPSGGSRCPLRRFTARRQTDQSSETRSTSVVGDFFFFLARKIKRAGVRRRNVKFNFKTGARRLRVLSLY